MDTNFADALDFDPALRATTVGPSFGADRFDEPFAHGRKNSDSVTISN
jgi:hypothetical protein